MKLNLKLIAVALMALASMALAGPASASTPAQNRAESLSVWIDCGVTAHAPVQNSTHSWMHGVASVGCNFPAHGTAYAKLQYLNRYNQWVQVGTTKTNTPSYLATHWSAVKTLYCKSGSPRRHWRTGGRVHYLGTGGIWHWSNWHYSTATTLACL